MAETMFGNMYDVRQKQNEDIRERSYKTAQLTPDQIMTQSSANAGGMLGQSIGGAFGMQSQAETKQAKINQLMKEFPNPTTYDEFMQLASKFKDAGMLGEWEKAHKMALKMAEGMGLSSRKLNSEKAKFDLAAQFVPCAEQEGGWQNASAECKSKVFAKHAEMERGDQIGNIYAKSDVDYISKDQEDLETETISAQKTVSDARFAKDLLSSGAKTGFGAEWGVEAKKFSNFFLGTDMETATTETLNSVFKSMTLEALSAMSGAASDKDVDFVEASGPTIGKTTASNLLLLDYRMFRGNYSKRLSNYLNKWNSKFISKNKGKRPTAWQYTEAKNKFRNSPENTFNLKERHKNLKVGDDSVSTATQFRNMSKQHKTNQDDIKKFEGQLD